MGGNLSSSKLLAGPSNDLVVQTIAVEPSSSTSTPSNVSTRVRNLVCKEGIGSTEIEDIYKLSSVCGRGEIDLIIHEESFVRIFR